MALSDAELRIMKEKIEILNGDRGDKARGKSALRREDITAVEKIVVTNKASTSDLSKKLEELIVEVQAAKDDITDIETWKAATEITLGTLTDDLDQAKADIDSIELIVADIQTGLGNANLAIDGLQATTAALTDDLSDAVVLLGQVKDAVDGIKSRATSVSVPAITSVAITAAPTAGEYNALRTDVINLRTALVSLKSAITG